MFIRILFSYIIGYVKIVVEGYYIERFINICTNQKILIWNLKRKNGVKLYLNVGINDFKKLIGISKKTKCKIKIESKKGVPFLLNRYKKRKIFLFLLIVVLLCIGLSSRYVWNIEVKEEQGESIENIVQDLKDAGLSVGILKNKVNKKEIINTIRLNRTDIAWMGIELKGTNAIVKIVKADSKPEIIDETEYCNIVSNKNGIITKINAQNGTAVVKVGDTVKEGTVLIEGVMEGKFTGNRYVHAIGEVEAKVWYTKSKKIYFKQEEYTETGEVENKYFIKFNNFEINFNKKLSKFKFYDTINTEKKLKLFSDFYLPISIIKISNFETIKQEKIYTTEEAIQLGIEQLENEMKDEINLENEILRKKYKYE